MSNEDDTDKKTFPHGSKEEAQRQFDELFEEGMNRHCPIRNGKCRSSCVCYVKLEIVNIDSVESEFWSCEGGYCTCYMLVGPT